MTAACRRYRQLDEVCCHTCGRRWDADEAPENPACNDIIQLRAAEAISRLSRDPSRKVGALVLDRDGVAYTGYNYVPDCLVDTVNLMDRDDKLRHTVHAEIAAIRRAGAKAVGATIYVWPVQPCAACALEIVAAGIVRVVTVPTAAQGWTGSIFRRAGVSLELLS